MTYSTSWNTEAAKSVFAQLTKVANDMLDTAAQTPSPESAGTAGPQEVVDALSSIVDELEAIQAAIPAEPSNGEEGLEQGAPVEAPKEPAYAKLTTKIAELEAKVESSERERVAEQFADLYDDAKIKQAKYDEVMISTEKPEFWTAKIEAISTFQKEAGVNSYKPAQQTNSWIQPRSKFAKLESEIVRL